MLLMHRRTKKYHNHNFPWFTAVKVLHVVVRQQSGCLGSDSFFVTPWRACSDRSPGDYDGQILDFAGSTMIVFVTWYIKSIPRKPCHCGSYRSKKSIAIPTHRYGVDSECSDCEAPIRQISCAIRELYSPNPTSQAVSPQNLQPRHPTP